MSNIKKYSAVDLLKLSPGVDAAASAKVALPVEFLNLCEVLMPGATKPYNKNQEPVQTLEETTAALYEQHQTRLAKKHKNYLRRQRAKLAKQLKKENTTENDSHPVIPAENEQKKNQTMDTGNVSSDSGCNLEETVSSVVIEKKKKKLAPVVPAIESKLRSNSPHKNDEVLYKITPGKIMPKNAGASSASTTQRVYKNSRLGLRRGRIGSNRD